MDGRDEGEGSGCRLSANRGTSHGNIDGLCTLQEKDMALRCEGVDEEVTGVNGHLHAGMKVRSFSPLGDGI